MEYTGTKREDIIEVKWKSVNVFQPGYLSFYRYIFKYNRSYYNSKS